MRPEINRCDCACTSDGDPNVATATDQVRPRRSWYVLGKVAFEFVLGVLLLALATPFILLAAILVKLTSRGPAFYSQIRLGKNGENYRIYKLRTMFHDCESKTGPRWATPDDPRITTIGRFLRLTHLDELPQLWNVLRGEMSLVGPRPERPEIADRLEQSVPRYGERLRVRPGITGLAQIHLPADTDLDSVRRKLVYDLYYIRTMSFWLDMKLLFGTGLYLMRIPFHVSCALLRVPSKRLIEEGWVAAEGGMTESPIGAQLEAT